MKQKTIIILVGLLLLALLGPVAAIAQEEVEGEDYTVQADDWLSKLADKFYGDALAYHAIVAATNKKAEADSSYTLIEDANVIEVGQKLFIPSGEAAEATIASRTRVLETAAGGADVTIGDVFFFARGFGPPDVGSFFDHRVTFQLYDGLVGFDGTAVAAGADPQLVPSLAESWEISDDALTYTFNLRSGIEFSTGRPVNASAVKKSLDRSVEVIALREQTSRYSWVLNIGSTEVVDELTFRINLTAPYAPLLAALASTNFMIVDADEAMAHEEEGDFGATWLSENSAGSGPFMIEEFIPEQRLTLRRNASYWGGADGVQPSVERLIFANVPENATRELMSGAGEIDVALQLDPISLATLGNSDTANVETFPTLLTCNFLLDLRIDALQQGHPKTIQAIRYAIDYEGLRDIVAGGLAEVRQTNFLPGMHGYRPEHDNTYTHDPERAKQLLAEAGFPDGFDVKIQNRAGACGAVTYKKATEFWQQNLAEVGINAEIVESTGANFWGAILAEELRDFGISGAGATYFDADHPASVRALQEAQLMGWDDVDPENAGRATELVQQGQSIANDAERDAIYAEIADLMLESSPYLTFLHVQDAVVVGNDIGGLVSLPGSFPISFKYITKE